MSTSVNSLSSEPESKPLVVLHRVPSFAASIYSHFSAKFSVIDPVSAVGPDLESGNEFLRAHASTTRALACVGLRTLGKNTLDCLPLLECVVVSSIGTDHIDLAECRRRGISVCNVGDAFSDDAADFAVGLLLDVLRKVSYGDRFVRARSWSHGDFPLGSRLGRKRVGIVGLGSIGSRVAKRLTPFGCSIAYNSRHRKPSVSFPYYDTVYDLALNSDILILSCSLTEQTHNLINKDIMNALGKEGIIINVGRGALIDEEELVRFLVEGRIGGAGLDVFENEPQVPKQLFGLENVVLTPHQAVLTPESFRASKDIMLANLEAFFSNKPLISPIKLE